MLRNADLRLKITAYKYQLPNAESSSLLRAQHWLKCSGLLKIGIDWSYSLFKTKQNPNSNNYYDRLTNFPVQSCKQSWPLRTTSSYPCLRAAQTRNSPKIYSVPSYYLKQICLFSKMQQPTITLLPTKMKTICRKHKIYFQFPAFITYIHPKCDIFPSLSHPINSTLMYKEVCKWSQRTITWAFTLLLESYGWMQLAITNTCGRVTIYIQFACIFLQREL